MLAVKINGPPWFSYQTSCDRKSDIQDGASSGEITDDLREFCEIDNTNLNFDRADNVILLFLSGVASIFLKKKS